MASTCNRPSAPFTISASHVKLRYEQSSALYASQFVVNAGDDELLIDCSSGVVIEGDPGQPTMPIHARLAMSWSAVERLVELLQQALSGRTSESATPSGRPDLGFAKLPTLEPIDG